MTPEGRPHRTWERLSALLRGHHPRTIEAIQFYEDTPGTRVHIARPPNQAAPGLAFDNAEDRNCVRELLLRIEDLERADKLQELRHLVTTIGEDEVYGDPEHCYIQSLMELLPELLETLEGIRSDQDG